MDRMVLVVRISQTVPNIEIAHHDQDIVDIDFSILKIL